MIIGTMSIPKVVEESICRIAKDYRLSDIGDYKIHSTSLMPNIPFEEAAVVPEPIDDSIFINDEETKLKFETKIKCQNFLTTHFVGRAPLEHYGGKTKLGREFLLVCREGDTAYKYRVFGTEAAIRGYNRDANELEQVPKEEA